MTSTRKPTRTRQSKASHRKAANSPAKARPPQPDTLTLEKFNEFFGEQITRYEDGKEFPCQQEFLEKRRPYVEQGNVLALFSAIQHCQQPTRRGFSFEDASLNPKLDSNMAVNEVPWWLLNATLKLLWRGIHGEWPKGKARHARASRLLTDRWRDLVRTEHVLKAREDGVAWEGVFEHVSETLDGAGKPRAVEAAYRRVAKAFRTDPTPYLLAPRTINEDWWEGLE